MKTVKKVFVFAITLAVLLSVSLTAFADDFDEPKYPGRDYYISAYDIQIDVLENNVLNVTEHISVYFNLYSHGIFRYIPVSNYIEREDGSYGNIKAKIRNVKVSDPVDTYYEDGNYVLQIGDGDVTIIGPKDYTISYSYVMGRDIGEGFDELYYNIIGTGWETNIENVTFTINMPKEFDESKLGFSAGYYGTAGVTDIEYSVNGHQISGRLTENLAPRQAFTVRLELPEGYFYFNYAAFYAMLALIVLVPVAALIAVAVLWKKYGKDKKIVKVVEFYPPEGMSSLDVAYWYKGAAVETDVIPLMIELANEGYININQIEKKKRFGKPEFLIERVKDYDGGDISKRIFFKGLFKCGNGKYATKKDLAERFYKYVEQILSYVNTDENRKKIYGAKSLAMRLLGWCISILSGIASVFITTQIVDGYEKYFAALIGVAISAVAFIFSFFIRQRTDRGHEILQKIIGFRMFLEEAEKERLETLVYENPTYYYDILPYAYVLGVSDVWTKNFEGIVMQPPTWYTGSTMFDRMVFWHFMNNTMHSATAAMTSVPQNASSGFSGGGISGGGGFSGGGFSGGGVGGGGGGRW
ncbi:MAG: DUF2207 domain-containing protein [Eubacterium sp.]|nr:DUF2207 domain-containing protein [Eubacterium sp.]